MDRKDLVPCEDVDWCDRSDEELGVLLCGAAADPEHAVSTAIESDMALATAMAAML